MVFFICYFSNMTQLFCLGISLTLVLGYLAVSLQVQSNLYCERVPLTCNIICRNCHAMRVAGKVKVKKRDA